MEQFTDDAFNKDFTQQYSLLLELDVNQLSFILYDKQTGRIAVLKRISFTQSKNAGDFVTTLKTAVNNEDLLHLAVKEIKISLAWNAFTCVPRTIYEEDLKTDYLKYSSSPSAGLSTRVNYIRPFFIKNVYALETELEKYLLHIYPLARLFHVSTALLEFAALHKDEDAPPQLILDVRQGIMFLLYLEDKELKYCNQFQYKSKEDFLYFVLLVCDQLNINRDNCTLQLSGYITLDSALYNELYKFFKNISFASVQEHFKLSSLDSTIPVHYFNTLLNLHICES